MSTFPLRKSKKNFFLLKIFYFSISLTSNKLYWIEDQLADLTVICLMPTSKHFEILVLGHRMVTFTKNLYLKLLLSIAKIQEALFHRNVSFDS